MKKGIFYAIMASLVFSIMNLLVKLVSANIPSTEVVFFRSIIGSIITLIIMRQKEVKFSKGNTNLLILRGILGSAYLVTYFYIISKMPLADVSILINLSPFFVIILSALVLKEKISSKIYVVLFFALTGALITINPFGYGTYSIIALIGVFSALCSASASITIRHLSKSKSTYEIVFYFLFIATIVSIPMMWNSFVLPTPLEFFYLICIGSVSFLGQIFLTKAYTHERAPVVAVARYTSIAFNVMWGLLLWSEIPNITTAIGGTLIVGSCIYLALNREK
ncbi:DMT family transporter [Wukongibacter sp. M2B1]|uniref:DMT family transporter n=1 Tax=Wukongibacter sp. M2B1 TaxID=3088895 RepID=UPI003D792D41